MQGEVDFPGVQVIDDIPYVVGADAVQKVFEKFGIRKSRKAVYKFISKSPLRRRVVKNGRSMIAVPISEIERWIRKNYPIVWESLEKGKLGENDPEDYSTSNLGRSGSEEKELIIKNFNLMSNFEKIIAEMERKIKDMELGKNLGDDAKDTEEKRKENLSDDDGGIWRISEDKSDKTLVGEAGNSKSGESSDVLHIDNLSPSDVILLLADNIIKTLIENPPKDFDMEKISEAERKLISALQFIENVSRIKKEGESSNNIKR